MCSGLALLDGGCDLLGSNCDARCLVAEPLKGMEEPDQPKRKKQAISNKNKIILRLWVCSKWYGPLSNQLYLLGLL